MEANDIRHASTEPAPPRRQITFTVGSMLTVLAVVVLCLASFFAGTLYQKNHTANTAAKAGSQTGQNAFSGFRGRRGSIGSVTAVSSTSITVSNQRTGTSNTYAINSSTVITKDGTAAAASDIQAGDTVLVRPAASDASVAASISVDPSFGGPGAGTAPSSGTTPGSST